MSKDISRQALMELRGWITADLRTADDIADDPNEPDDLRKQSFGVAWECRRTLKALDDLLGIKPPAAKPVFRLVGGRGLER